VSGAWWLVWVVTACVPEGPLVDRWNGVFEIDTLRSDPSCDPPTTEQEPPLPYVGLGYGADEEIQVVTMFWCDAPVRCIDQPVANAWLEVATERRVSGEFAEASMVAASLCNLSWNRIEATQTDAGRLTLDVTLASPDPIEVEDAKECAELAGGVPAQCTERLVVEATRAD
jgi:hypothetical protein